MFNIHTKEYETPETTKATIGTTYSLNRMFDQVRITAMAKEAIMPAYKILVC